LVFKGVVEWIAIVLYDSDCGVFGLAGGLGQLDCLLELEMGKLALQLVELLYSEFQFLDLLLLSDDLFVVPLDDSIDVGHDVLLE
jgi:hypothetical protein